MVFKKIYDILGTVIILAGLIKPTIELIKVMEETFEDPKTGIHKKNLILETMGEIIDGMGKIIPINLAKEKILGFLDNVIDIIVKAFNIVGIFKKSE